MRKIGLFFCLVVLALVGPVAAQNAAPNPYALYFAEVVRIIAGDTLGVRVDLLPGVQAVYLFGCAGLMHPNYAAAPVRPSGFGPKMPRPK